MLKTDQKLKKIWLLNSIFWKSPELRNLLLILGLKWLFSTLLKERGAGEVPSHFRGPDRHFGQVLRLRLLIFGQPKKNPKKLPNEVTQKSWKQRFYMIFPSYPLLSVNFPRENYENYQVPWFSIDDNPSRTCPKCPTQQPNSISQPVRQPLVAKLRPFPQTPGPTVPLISQSSNQPFQPPKGLDQPFRTLPGPVQSTLLSSQIPVRN
jgi:hypothetical protein